MRVEGLGFRVVVLVFRFKASGLMVLGVSGFGIGSVGFMSKISRHFWPSFSKSHHQKAWFRGLGV